MWTYIHTPGIRINTKLICTDYMMVSKKRGKRKEKRRSKDLNYMSVAFYTTRKFNSLAALCLPLHFHKGAGCLERVVPGSRTVHKNKLNKDTELTHVGCCFRFLHLHCLLGGKITTLSTCLY